MTNAAGNIKGIYTFLLISFSEMPANSFSNIIARHLYKCLLCESDSEKILIDG